MVLQGKNDILKQNFGIHFQWRYQIEQNFIIRDKYFQH